MLNSKNFYINRYNFSSLANSTRFNSASLHSTKKLKLYYCCSFLRLQLPPIYLTKLIPHTHRERHAVSPLSLHPRLSFKAKTKPRFACKALSRRKNYQRRVDLLSFHFPDPTHKTSRTIIFHLLLCTFLIRTMQITTIQ